MKIAIVNDMQVAVEGLRRVLMPVKQHEVVWVARNGQEAVERCTHDLPDLILMDLIMPVMDGVEATRQIMTATPCPILVVTSSVEDNAAMVFQAMGFGALDAVSTPILGLNGEVDGDISLLKKIATIKSLTEGDKKQESRYTITSTQSAVSEDSLLAIGSSTGGPLALSKILGCLPADFPASIVIIQHVDKDFATELAEWLDRQCELNVKVAYNGARLQAGTAYIAETNDHLVLSGNNKLLYEPEPHDLVYRPSVDVFFNSVATHWKGRLVAVLLTGMGRDGANGLLTLKERGAHTIAQDKESCAVYGMPKAAAELGAAVEVMSVDKIGPSLLEYFMGDAGDEKTRAI